MTFFLTYYCVQKYLEIVNKKPILIIEICFVAFNIFSALQPVFDAVRKQKPGWPSDPSSIFFTAFMVSKIVLLKC